MSRSRAFRVFLICLAVGTIFRVATPVLADGNKAAEEMAATTVGEPQHTRVFLPVKDNTLIEDPTGMLSNGDGDYLFVGQTNQKGANLRRALVAFDLSSLVPADATIDSAELTLVYNLTISGPSNVTVHRVTQDWGEAGSEAGEDEGEGTQAQNGDATWLDAFFSAPMRGALVGGTTWTTEGGDFVPTASATTSIGALGDAGPVSWQGASLAADAQAWVDTPSNNFGWVLVGDEASAPPTAKRLLSRKAANGAERPTLTLVYTSPSTVFFDGFESGGVTPWSASTGFVSPVAPTDGE